MRAFVILRSAIFLLPLGFPAIANSATPDVATVLTQANHAFSAGKPVTSVEMKGTAQWTAGSTKDSGPVTLTAKTTGENRVELDLGGGTRVESQSAATEDRTCSWSGKDGVVHETASSNCWTSTVWFLPHLALQSGPKTALSATDLGVVADKTQQVHKIQYRLTIAPGKTKPAVTAQIQSWSKTDLALDPASLLPSTLKYTIHPDNNSSVNLPVEVRYSNYQTVSGVALPFHIERYVNGSLQVSIDVTSAAVN